jgi:hypothetical protein
MMNFKHLLKVTFGIGFMLIALFLLFQNVFLGGIIFFIGGIFLLPQTLNFIENKLGKPLGRISKYLIIIGCVILGFISIANHSSKSYDQERELKDQEAYNQLPQHIKDSLNLAKQTKDSLNLVAKEQKDLQEKIERQFNAWNGSHIGLTRFIKDNMNDPDSYDHIETRFRNEGNSLYVVTKFRGKNAFGGMVINTVSARVDLDGNVLEIISQE